MMKRAAVLFIAALCLSPAAHASDDVQHWSRWTLNTWKSGRASLSTYGELRLMDDIGDARLYQVSEKFAYRWLDDLDLGVNYTYISQKVADRAGRDEFKYQHRAELEASPHWDLDGRLTVKNRNRFEFRWIEDQGSDNTRFRQLWELVIPVKGRAPFKAFYVNSEYFYDFNKSEVNENRATPAGVEFNLNERASLKVFYMVQAKKGTSDWSSNQVVGTHLTLTF